MRFYLHGNRDFIKTISILAFFVGLLLISFPAFIGLTLIRIVGLLMAILSGLGVYFTEGTIWGRDRSFFLVSLLAGILVLVFPTLIMIIFGLGLLSFAVYKFFFFFKDKHNTNKNDFIIALITLIVGLILMFNGRSAIETIVRIIGVFVVSFSAILFYKTLED
jgi:uncharacterized membrane protein HdeD (DUF308 family)